jgi:hypothetical protein
MILVSAAIGASFPIFPCENTCIGDVPVQCGQPFSKGLPKLGLKVGDGWKSTQLPVLVKGRQAVLATSLNIQGCEVKAMARFAGRLEKVT